MTARIPHPEAPVSSRPPPSPMYRHCRGATPSRLAIIAKSSGSGFLRPASQDSTRASTRSATGSCDQASASSVVQSLSTPTRSPRARTSARTASASGRKTNSSRCAARRAAQAAASARSSGTIPLRRASSRNVAVRSPRLPVARSAYESFSVCRQAVTSTPSGAALREVCSCQMCSGVLGVSVPKKSKMTAAKGMSPLSVTRRRPGRIARGGWP